MMSILGKMILESNERTSFYLDLFFREQRRPKNSRDSSQKKSFRQRVSSYYGKNRR